MARMSDEARAKMLAEYAGGVHASALAETYGISERNVRALAKRHGIKPRALRTAPSLSGGGSIDEIRRLACMGRKRTEIAALLRCPYREVDAALA